MERHLTHAGQDSTHCDVDTRAAHWAQATSHACDADDLDTSLWTTGKFLTRAAPLCDVSGVDRQHSPFIVKSKPCHNSRHCDIRLVTNATFLERKLLKNAYALSVSKPNEYLLLIK